MKILLERIIQKRNPQFSFDVDLTNNAVLALVLEKGFAYLRGFKLLFRFKNNKHILLGSKVKFFNIANINFGKWVNLEDNVKIKSLGKKPIVLGNNVRIGSHSKIVTSTSFNNLGSHIYIGNNVGIGEFAYLGGAGGLEIGDNTIVGQYFSCHPENHVAENPNKLVREQGVTRKGIRIGQNCWIGAKVTILDGVEIGDNCIIAAGAVVTKSVKGDTVVAGVPAKIIKEKKAKFPQKMNLSNDLLAGLSNKFQNLEKQYLNELSIKLA